MRAVLFDGKLLFVIAYPKPVVPTDWALINMRMAGICKTDLEITQGCMDSPGYLYMNSLGALGSAKTLTGLASGWWARSMRTVASLENGHKHW